MSTQFAEPTYVGDLGNGLIRRWSTLDDHVEIGHLMATVFRDSPDAPVRADERDSARIMMSDQFPFMGPGDFAVVQDTNRQEHPLVACTCFFRHQWRYADIPFGVGRPEEVATDPAYRNRGLVRALFEMVHARSAAEGHLVQAITGIEYFYRQFGYEYVLDLDGYRTTYIASIPAKGADESEPYRLRPATLDDVSDLDALYNGSRRDSLVWHEAPIDQWRFLISSWDEPAIQGMNPMDVGLKRRLHMIVDAAGDTCGYVCVASKRRGQYLYVVALELAPHVNWQEAMPSLLRALRTVGEATPAKAEAEPLGELRFGFGRAHPVYDVLGQGLAPQYVPPYAWYLRVPDIPAFIQHITPVLEERLANSLLANHNGELKIDFYRGGLRMQIEKGRLVLVEPWRAPVYGDNAQAGCPALIFLQLLFGYRSLAELRAIFPDVWAKDSTVLLINTLFPAQPSMVYPLA